MKNYNLKFKFIFLTTFCLAILGWAEKSFAAPVVSGVSGTVAHGQNVTISGSGFGNKSSAAPLVWDNCSGTTITTLWGGRMARCWNQ
jgi:hypothetical protein